MKIYACGSRPDHFTGWGGVGSPIYATYGTSDTNTPYGLGTTALNTTAPSGEPNGWGYGCLWMDFTNADNSPATLTDFWLGTNGYYVAAAVGGTASYEQYAACVLHTNASTYILLKNLTPTSSTCGVYLTTSLTDSSQYVDTGLSATRTSSNGLRTLDIKVSGAGTTNGTISLYVDSVLSGTWSGDLTNYPGFTAVSFHRATPATATWFSLTYAFVTDMCTVGHTFNYEVITAAPHMRSDWSGDTTTFGVYPVDYTASGGLYSTGYAQAVSFLPAKTYPAITAAGSVVGAVLIQGTLVSDTAVGEVGAFAVSSDGFSTASGAPILITQTGKNITYTMDTNPITGNVWDITSVNSLELGFMRMPDLGTATNDFGGDIA